MNLSYSNPMIHSNLILPRLKARNRWQAIDKLAATLYMNGYVNETYTEAVKVRELDFPTGLPTVPYSVAIPHADTEHSIHPAIAVGILHSPVPWIEIATNDSWLQVKVVFLLAITEPNVQVTWLKRLTDAFNINGMLAGLVTLYDPQAVLGYLLGYLEEQGQLAR